MRQKPAEGANIPSISSATSAEQLELGKYYNLVTDESERSHNSLRFLLRFHFFHTRMLTLQKPFNADHLSQLAAFGAGFQNSRAS